MKRLTKLLLFVLLFTSISASVADTQAKPPILHPRGLLWKIEKSGVEPSYLFGTMHVSDPRVTRLAAEVERAFMGSQHFVMEMIMNFQAVGYVTSASFFNNGQTLNELMGEDQYQLLKDLINRRLFVAESMLRHMKPWAVMIMLMMPSDQKASDGAALDMVLLRRATRLKKKITGLESAQEQIAVFESLSLEDQVWMLNRAVAEIERSDEQMPGMYEAYLQGDLQELVYIQQQFMYDDSDIDDRFMHQLLDVRNHRMAKRLKPVLEQGNAFVAIGALHLPDEKGVLNLLKQQGYQVTPVF